MKRFTREDLQRVHTVYEHLAFIRNEWGEKIDHASLRRGSASLHSFLTENLLRIIWAKTMEEFAPSPVIETLTIETLTLNYLNVLTRDQVIWAVAGGGRCEGQEFKGSHLLTSQSEPSLSPETTRVPMPLQDFLMSPCIVISGVDISRQTLINYAANTLGDVHDDPSHEEGRLYSLLDQASGGIGLLDKKAIHCELLTCAQSLAGSRMIERFYRMIVPL